MKEIKLANTDRVALVDDCDYDLVMRYKWHLQQKKNKHGVVYNYYAISTLYDKEKRKKYPRSNGNITLWMQRFILDCPAGMQVDHINHNGLDNRRENIRICSRGENMKNKKTWAKSGYLGVYTYRSTPNKPWCSYITTNGRCIFLGNFSEKEDAARAYDEAAKKYHKEFANLNFK